ncbi:glycosyltransferase family 4 protein [Nodosilinea sp. LEGE 06152]|uniref:glycosyltransferase n=1 Tax=Nodosilinea sp. LEGE 06152 TaxID=2777966 RepID=UPI001882823B|nr:glycosyltransferase [Nodosilinea sp. LEGE 06152]MBE9159301.1 glycosyltransferase family 4 protein [Nodosilinea sp. LEGE 06152]
MQRLRILTWHVHGSYLYYLTQCPHDFYLPTKPGHPEGYGGRLPGFDWGHNVFDIAAEDVRHQEFDCILYQSRRNYEQDQHEILSPEQRQLPQLFLEHDPPREHPTDTRHGVDDPGVLLVHVTAFNRLMWDCGRTPTRVIEHGVTVPEEVQYTGEIAKGIVVVNGLRSRGRRLGADLFQQVRQHIPLDLVGMDSESLGGLGNISHRDLPALMARYRFFFHPVRYTSLGLAVCEAMYLGLPIVGLATTELPTVVENDVSGFIHTDPAALIKQMQQLIDHPDLARHLSQGAQTVGQTRFNLYHFVQDWNAAFADAIQLRQDQNHRPPALAAPPPQGRSR